MFGPDLYIFIVKHYVAGILWQKNFRILKMMVMLPYTL